MRLCYQIAISFFIFGSWNKVFAATCDLSKVPLDLRSYAEAFRESEKTVIADPVPSLYKTTPQEFIFRAKARNWAGYKWNIDPIQLKGTLLAQEKYIAACAALPRPLIADVIDYAHTDKLSLLEQKKAQRSLLLFLPCAEGYDKKLLKDYFFKHFREKPDSFLDLLIATESESLAKLAQYKACTEVEVNEKFPLTDFFVEDLEKFIQQTRNDKAFLLRLRRLRETKSRFETAKHLFERLDEHVGIKD